MLRLMSAFVFSLMYVAQGPLFGAPSFSAALHDEYVSKAYRQMSELKVDDVCKARFICAEDIFWSRRKKSKFLIVNWMRSTSGSNALFYKNAIRRYQGILSKCDDPQLLDMVNYRIAWCKRNYYGDYMKNIDSIIAHKGSDESIYQKALKLKSLPDLPPKNWSSLYDTIEAYRPVEREGRNYEEEAHAGRDHQEAQRS